jgi:hypothetical protein
VPMDPMTAAAAVDTAVDLVLVEEVMVADVVEGLV